jgi:hypothetical protein
MRAVWKVRGLTLLIRVGTLWRCGDGLFFKVSPLASDALLTTLHPLLENVLQTVDHFEIYCLGAPFSWLEKPRNRTGQDLACMADVLMGMMAVPIRSSAPCDFWALPTNHIKRSKPPVPLSSRSLWQTVCSTFSRSGWSVVRSALLAKGNTSKRDRHRTSTKFRLGVIRWVLELLKLPSYFKRSPSSLKETMTRYYWPSQHSIHT